MKRMKKMKFQRSIKSEERALLKSTRTLKNYGIASLRLNHSRGKQLTSRVLILLKAHARETLANTRTIIPLKCRRKTKQSARNAAEGVDLHHPRETQMK